MPLRVNPALAAVAEPPIAEAYGWIKGREFPADKPLIDVSQAVPGYPPAKQLTDHLAARVGEPAHLLQPCDREPLDVAAEEHGAAELRGQVPRREQRGADHASSPPSSSRSQAAASASLGMRQSPRGERLTEPTFGPSGITERFHCWLKKRRRNSSSHLRSAASS